MPTCFVKGCKSSGFRKKKKEQEKRSLFHPTTDEMLEQWKSAVPGGENLEKKHVICDLHFLPEDIIKDYVEHCSAALTPHLYIQPLRYRLKKGAVPSIFPNLEETLHESISEEIKKLMKNSNFIDIPLHLALDEQFLEETEFKIILEKCNMVPTPSTYWVVNNTNDTIVWNCWTVDYLNSSHKVVLHSDMSVQTFVKDREVIIEHLKTVKNTNDIIKLLDEVSALLPCFKKDLVRSEDCAGYVLQKDVKRKGPQIEICESCRRSRRKVMRKNNEDNFKARNLALQKKVKRCNQPKKRITEKKTRNDGNHPRHTTTYLH